VHKAGPKDVSLDLGEAGSDESNDDRGGDGDIVSESLIVATVYV
jgi:hypothetical protein